MFKKFIQFLKELDPVKLGLDTITILLLLGLVIQFFRRIDIPATEWLADLYKVILPICAGFYEINRWATGDNRETPFTQRERAIQGEYYVAAWTVVTGILLFLQVIFFNYYSSKPAEMITITSEVWGIFVATNGSKKFKELRAKAQDALEQAKKFTGAGQSEKKDGT